MNETLTSVTHAARYARRRAIANAVEAAGGSTRGIAAEFGVSETTVCYACREFGVTIVPRRLQGQFSSYRVIAALFDPARTLTQIGQDLNVSHQRVGMIYRTCREAGVPVPVRHVGGRTKNSVNGIAINGTMRENE